MPDIHIPDDVYEQLGRHARPFETPAEVIKRLLDARDGTGGQPPRQGRRPGKLRPHTLKGAVRKRWGDEDKPHWDFERTTQVCEEEDEKFRRAGENPAPELRRRRDQRDQTYVRTWVYGCHFEWLNPR